MPVEEYVDAIDEEDRVIGKVTISECKRSGLLHRAVTIFVLNSRHEMYIQQRSRSDDWLPGKWTASCTGHVKSGEDPQAAAIRELREELGLDALPVFLFKFPAPVLNYGGGTEREMDYVFECMTDARVQPDPIEVEQIKLLSLKECKSFFFEHREEITLDAVSAFEKYIRLQGL